MESNKKANFILYNAKMERIFDTVERSAKFRTREFVVEYAENPSYPEHIKLQVTQDKVMLLDKFKLGDEVNVHFNLRGRLWVNPQGQEVWMTNLEAWRIENATGASPGNVAYATDDFGPATEPAPRPSAQERAPAKPFEDSTDFGESQDDDLPF